MTYKIHPAIGIARLGNSPDEFYLAPEREGDLPIACDSDGLEERNSDGTPRRVTQFKDGQGRIKRQAARFRVFAYDEATPEGRELKTGDTIQFILEKSGQRYEGRLLDIVWTVYLANKKAAWYEFMETQGEHGYDPSHPLRNAGITEPAARQKLIIDPGPQSVQYTKDGRRTAHFAAGANPGMPQNFPPPLQPASITTLGEIRTHLDDGHNRLLVLGGHGNSGSFKTEFGQPYITTYANNDGWFDDTSDGPVTAALLIEVTTINGQPPNPNLYRLPMQVSVPVDASAWVIVGYPRYAPQVVDMVTMNDVVYDVAIRYFAFDPALYGIAPYDSAKAPVTPGSDLDRWRREAAWNPDYHPYFQRDIWPILKRPSAYAGVMVFDPILGGDPHNTGARGNFDEAELGVPPHHGEAPEDRERRAKMRMFLYRMLRKPGHENQFALGPEDGGSGPAPIGMPWLCGDNPISNVAPSKFLRLTDTMLFLLWQWALGKFINEATEGITSPTGGAGVELDRGILSNVLGGSFCPGAEASWIMRNPAIYQAPYRVHRGSSYAAGNLDPMSHLATGLEPGDLTKYSALPWQSDFNECSTQAIDVTYEDWNVINPGSTGDPVVSNLQMTFWWPSHRPMQVTTAAGASVPWSGSIPQTNLGDLQMVSAWPALGFVIFDAKSQSFVLTESSL